MRQIWIVCAIVCATACFVYAADDSPQIMIRAEFISVPKTVLDSAGRSGPDQLPTAKQILGFKTSGEATILHSPMILLQSGQESAVRAVQEAIYPTDFHVTSYAVTNDQSQVTVSTVVAPSSFETREVGAIFRAFPTLDARTLDISLTFVAELVSAPVWREYAAHYTDTIGNAKTTQLEQPFFFKRSTSASIRIKNGSTVLAAGGMADRENLSVTFLLIKVQLVDSEGQRVTVEQFAEELSPAAARQTKP